MSKTTLQFAEIPLTPPERRFVEFRLANPRLSAYDAFVYAYPQAAGRTTRGVGTRLANRMITRPRVAQALGMVAAEARQRGLDTRDRVLAELRAMAFATIDGVVTLRKGRMNVKDFDRLTLEQRSAVKKVKIYSGRDVDDEGNFVVDRVEIEMHDKQKALAELAKIEGMVQGKGENAVAGGYSLAQAISAICEMATPEELEALRGIMSRLAVTGDSDERDENEADLQRAA
jgi:hypothetical protein